MSTTTRTFGISASLESIGASWATFWRNRWERQLKDVALEYRALVQDGNFDAPHKTELSKRIKHFAGLLKISETDAYAFT